MTQHQPAPESRPLNHFDVTGRIKISDPVAVRDAVIGILRAQFADLQPEPLHHAFHTFTRLYAGDLPGYAGVDTWYHDAQHSLDCALAMARLLDGFQRDAAPAEALTSRRAVLGVIIALFHDAGYIRRGGDTAKNGAEYTLFHVRRSADFLREYLPTIGFAAEAGIAAQLVHFTGYEVELDRIRVADRRDRILGFLLGTADCVSQFADRCYIEKCRDLLPKEFEIAGLLGEQRKGGPTPIYKDVEDLLTKTHAFHEKLRRERLDGYFESVHRYMAAHFGGDDPYMASIAQHLQHLDVYLRTRELPDVRRMAEVIGADAMRAALKDPRLSESLAPATA